MGTKTGWMAGLRWQRLMSCTLSWRLITTAIPQRPIIGPVCLKPLSVTWGKCQSNLLSTVGMTANWGGRVDALADRAATQRHPVGWRFGPMGTLWNCTWMKPEAGGTWWAVSWTWAHSVALHNSILDNIRRSTASKSRGEITHPCSAMGNDSKCIVQFRVHQIRKGIGQLKDFSKGLSKMVRGQSTCLLVDAPGLGLVLPGK